MNRDGAVVLLSGGADSCIALFVLRASARRPLITVTFDYGQRHRIELDRAREISKLAGAEHHEVKLDLGGAIPSALTTGDAIGAREDGLPTTFVPGRNAIFLSVAAGIAKARGITMLGVGFSQIDYSGYPDCRADFVQKMEDALASGVEERRLRIYAPLLFQTKAQSVRAACMISGCWEALGHSWSCYAPQPAALQIGPVPCGECPACVLRAKGFEEAGLADPAFGR